MFKNIKEGYKFANIISRIYEYIEFNRTTSGMLRKQVVYTYIINLLVRK